VAIRKKYRVSQNITNGKIKRRRKPFFKFNKRRFLKFALLSMFVLAILCFFGGLIVFAYFAKDLPDPEKINARRITESTKIYDRTGEAVLYEIHGEEKRTIVPLDKISDYMKQATIAAEDDQFYSHRGFDLGGIVKAVCHEIGLCKESRGGSTITQQLIKNSILTSEKTYARKIKEIILSIEMERKFSKNEILEMYLNQIPYGSNAYGIEAAAQTFFGKNAKDLDLSESALLACLPKLTTYYSPYGSNPEKLKARWEYILERMHSLGYISEQEKTDANSIDILTKVQPFQEKILAPHFVMFVREYLVEKYGEEKIEQGGLKVYTTLDLNLQKIAEEEIKNKVEKNTNQYNAYNAALTAINPQNGQILAMVGSKSYFDEPLPVDCVPGKNCKFEPNVNVAIRSRQPGSSFKPFVYAAAFEKGYTPETILFDVKTEFNPSCPAVAEQTQDNSGGKCYHPNNYDGKFHGPVTMRQALAQSLNIPAVKTLYLTGVNNAIKTARKMGITTLNEPDRYGLSLVLGGGEVKLLDEVSAFGVFANEGIKNKTVPILKIENSQSEILEEFKLSSQKVLDKNIANTINNILSDNVARTPAFGAQNPLTLPNRPVAAKTGTTNEYRDAWTIGYAPSLAAGVWSGNNDNSKMYKAPGVYLSAPIWNNFMKRALEGTPVENFTAPEPMEADKAILAGEFAQETKVKIDKACGDKLASEFTPEEQIEEKIYQEIHSILYYLDKNNPQGDFPSSPQNDPQFSNWEQAVLSWAEKNELEANQEPPTEICQIHSEENKPKIEIISPKEDEVISERNIFIKTEISAELKVKQADFFLDDEFIGSRSAEPYNLNFFLPGGIEDKKHCLNVKAYDEVNNMNEEKVCFLVNLNNQIIFKDPKQKNFPFELEVFTDPSLGEIKKVSFYCQTEDKDGRYFSFKIKDVYSTSKENIYKTEFYTDQIPIEKLSLEEEDIFKQTYLAYVLVVTKDGEILQSNIVAIKPE
jgi:1A family penicillin-binding protein